jgi:Transposase DDE domain group 1
VARKWPPGSTPTIPRGQQELALFNAHYDCTCFQPIRIFEALSGKPVLALLRPGKRPSGAEVATLYEEVFCARGAAENLIKDMKRWTRSDKTACSRWQANQFRLFLHVGAYWLLYSLRRAAPKRSRWRGATFETIRRTFVRRARRGAERQDQARLPRQLPAGCHARGHDRRHHHARAITAAASDDACQIPPPSIRRINQASRLK